MSSEPSVSEARRRRQETKRTDVAGILKLKKPITVEAVRRGLPIKVVDQLRDRLAITNTEMISTLRLAKQTYARRRKAGRLTAEESDRVVRYAELLAKATDLLGDPVHAAQWLRAPAPALEGESPLMHATTELGARDVLRLLGRLEHGIAT